MCLAKQNGLFFQKDNFQEEGFVVPRFHSDLNVVIYEVDHC